MGGVRGFPSRWAEMRGRRVVCAVCGFSFASLRDALHAGGVGAGSPGCEATPGQERKRMNNPGGVEGSGAFAPLPGCVFVMKRVVPGVRASHDPGLSAPIPPG